MSNLINKVKAAVSSTPDTYDENGPHNSSVANKADPRVDSDRDHRNNPHSTVGSSTGGYGSSTTGTTVGSTNAGPHNSNLANQADPRVDSDRDHRGTTASTTTGHHSHGTATGAGTTTGYGTSTGNTATGTSHSGSINAGPHNSNLLNKADPRVDSDRDHRQNPASATSGHHTHSTAAGTGTTSGYGSSTGQTTSGAGYGHSTNAGPHNSNLANKTDPRVDSDRDHRQNPASATSGYGATTGHSTTAGHGTTGGYGTTGTGTSGTGYNSSTNAGPHDSNLANKADPRVDSDRDHRQNPTSHVPGTTHHGAAAHHATTTPGSGTAQQTAGPHNSNLLNKLDPRVDSDLDGSKTVGGNATHR